MSIDLVKYGTPRDGVTRLAASPHVCVCDNGLMPYRTPTGTIERAPIRWRCAGHAPGYRKADAAHTSLLKRARYLATRAILIGPVAA